MALAATLTCFALGCHTKGKDCKSVMDVTRGLDDKDLLRLPAKPSDIEPIASYFSDIHTKIVACEATLHDETARQWATQIDALVVKRVDLLSSSTFAGAGGGVVTNSNFAALRDNQSAIDQAKSDFITACF